MDNIIIHYYIMEDTLENQILINKEGHNEDALTSSKPLGFSYEREDALTSSKPLGFSYERESSLIDIESNCCNFNNNQRNTRRKIINISIILMNLITLAGIITLLVKK